MPSQSSLPSIPPSRWLTSPLLPWLFLAASCTGSVDNPGWDTPESSGDARSADEASAGADETSQVGPRTDSNESSNADSAGASEGETDSASALDPAPDELEPEGESPSEPRSTNDGMLSEPVAEGVAAEDEASQQQDPDLFDVAQSYFPTAGQPPEKRLFRLTRRQLELTTEALLPDLYDASLSAVMPADPLQSNYEFSENLSFNQANFSPYTGWVSVLSGRAGGDPRVVIDCDEDDRDCLVDSAQDLVLRAFRGVPSQAQQQRFVEFFVNSVDEVGFSQAVSDLVDVVLTSPHYVFRDEALIDDNGVLLPAQRLAHLTYTLTDAPPEVLGFAPGQEAAVFATAETQREAVQNVLSSDLAREKLVRFLVAWLEIKQPSEFTLADSVYPEFSAEVAQAIVEDTRRFLRQALESTAPSLKDVTQSTASYVSDALAAIYEPSEGQRLGIFTDPAFIASHSGPESTRLVKRGVFFTRKVMCIPLGMPPEGAVTTIPNIPDVTERERVQRATEPAECSSCHSVINPFGFMLESYDAMGRFRTEDEAGLAIDPSTTVDFLDEGPLHANTAVEALSGLTQSFRFQQCFARQMFRYYLGRSETSGDDPVLRQMFFHFASEDEQGIVEMLQRMALSTPLATRQETP